MSFLFLFVWKEGGLVFFFEVPYGIIRLPKTIRKLIRLDLQLIKYSEQLLKYSVKELQLYYKLFITLLL